MSKPQPIRDTRFFNRKRKPKYPCQVCFLREDLCLCSTMPSLALRTKLSLIIHKRELSRTTNTGRLAVEALTNSEMRIRGIENQPLDLRDLISADYDTLLLYPSDNATPITPAYIQSFTKPIRLIVPDGNWRQASKVNTRFPELKDVPRVKITAPNKDRSYLRKETTENGMATLQAIAHAFGVIEGGHIRDQLLELYAEKLNRTLMARGQSKVIRY